MVLIDTNDNWTINNLHAKWINQAKGTFNKQNQQKG